jgi:hypothetical protein
MGHPSLWKGKFLNSRSHADSVSFTAKESLRGPIYPDGSCFFVVDDAMQKSSGPQGKFNNRNALQK